MLFFQADAWLLQIEIGYKERLKNNGTGEKHGVNKQFSNIFVQYGR